jgi:hypothetical protein
MAEKFLCRGEGLRLHVAVSSLWLAFPRQPLLIKLGNLSSQTVENKVEADSMNSQEQFCNSNHAAEMDMAERELCAFIGAVTQLFGPEEAKLSAEDWLDEAELMDSPARSTSRNWQAVTIAASADWQIG